LSPFSTGLVGERVVVGVEDDDLYAALTDNIVAFEVDRIDGETNLGWTVLVVGRSRPAGDLSLAGFEVPGYELPEPLPSRPRIDSSVSASTVSRVCGPWRAWLRHSPRLERWVRRSSRRAA